MPKALPEPNSFPSQERFDRFRAQRAVNNHCIPYGPKPIGKRAPIDLSKSFRLHSREGHAWRHEQRKPTVKLYIERREAEKKAERERILYGTKPTLEQRLAAIPPSTYTPIVHKPILLNFERLTAADLVRIFDPKYTATLKRLNVFETFQFSDEIDVQQVKDIDSLIARLTHLHRALKDLGRVTTTQEWQSWNYGFKEISNISFKGLRTNQVQIAKALSAVYRTNYFG